MPALLLAWLSLLGYLLVGTCFAPIAFWRTMNACHKEGMLEKKAHSEAIGNSVAVTLTWPVTVPIWSYCVLFKSVINHAPADAYKLDTFKQGRLVDPAYVKQLERETGMHD